MNALADIQTALCEIIRIVILLVFFAERGSVGRDAGWRHIRNECVHFVAYPGFLWNPKMVYQGLFVSIGNQKRMDDILLLPERNQEEAGRKCGNVTSLELDDVKFQYEETGKCLFDHLSYRFASGDTVVIRGNSGSGKTSLLKLLLRLKNQQR